MYINSSSCIRVRGVRVVMFEVDNGVRWLYYVPFSFKCEMNKVEMGMRRMGEIFRGLERIEIVCR